MAMFKKQSSLSVNFLLILFSIAGLFYFSFFIFSNFSSADEFLIVTSFAIPPSSSSTTISITDFTATDDVGVTGYLINESTTTPSLSDPKWETSATTTYTFTLTGTRTLYAWAKDADNNISDYASSSILVDISNPVVTSFEIPDLFNSTTVPINSFTAKDSYNWSAVGPVNDATKYWYSADITPDGSTIIAGFKNGRLYISTTTGATWTEVQPAGNSNLGWYTSAISDNGSVMIAGYKPGRLYISTTTGAIWKEVQPAGDVNKDWWTTAMSADGAVMIAGSYNETGRLYMSTNTGATWTELKLAGDINYPWIVSNVSDNGSVMLAGAYPGRLYMSTTTGATWTEVQPVGDIDKPWWTSAMSADGSIIVAGCNYGRLYMSTTTGATWTEVRPAGNVNEEWRTSTMSADGSIMIAGTADKRIYHSITTGATWDEIRPAGNIDTYWQTSTMSADGSIITASDNSIGKGFYIGHINSMGVSGYLVTESSNTPSLSDPKWETTATTTYTFASAGAKTLYAWARDFLGNISSSSAETIIDVTTPVITTFNVPSSATSTIINSIDLIAVDDNFAGSENISEVQPVGDTDKPWWTSAMSADGVNIIAADAPGRLYRSTTSGATWEEVQPAGAIDANWMTSAMSADGANIIAAVSPGRLYRSTTSGATWEEVQPAGAIDANWMTSAMSADGENIIAGVYMGRLYRSTTSGATWAEIQPAGAVNANWAVSAISADGANIIAGAYPGRLYRSVTSGATWQEIQPAGAVNANWRTSAMSADGENVIVAVSPGRLYRSTTSGATWAEIQPAGAVNANWAATAMSADGANIIAAVSPGRLYRSTTSGATWAEIQPAGAVNAYWAATAISADGSNIIVGFLSGRLYMITNFYVSYLINESASIPSLSDLNWKRGPVSAYTFLTDGVKTLYAWAKDLFGNISTSFSRIITVDTTAPSVSNISALTTISTATVAWTTDENATSTIYYGTSASYGLESSSNIPATAHSFVISGLESVTTYNYMIETTDQYGHTSTTSNRTFQTLGICPTLSNATSYNVYPTCGAATCATGYHVSGGVCVQNGGGGMSIAPVLPKPIIADFKLSINNGDNITAGRMVWLSFDFAGLGVTQIQASEDPTFFGAVKNYYNGIMPFILSDTAGEKTVYAKFYIGNDYSIAQIADTIVYAPNNASSSSSADSNPESPANSSGLSSTYWNTGEYDNWGSEIVCSLDNFSPAAKEQRRLEAETMAKKIKEIIEKQKNETYAQRLKRLDLERRLSGRVLLQVEEKGEAWYLDPVSKNRYFLGRPTDMFNIMKKLGLGATHKYISETITFPDRLSGRILLDVEDKGRAYYINPVDKKKYYLACPNNAFKVIRKLGLGISNANLEYIKAGEN